MLPKAILFDLDDTIISFDSHTEICWQKVCMAFTEKYKLFSYEKIFTSIQEARTWYWSDEERHRIGRLNLEQIRRQIVVSAFEKLKCFDEKYGIELADEYSKLHNEMITLFPHALETLQELSRSRIKLGLLTNGNSEIQKNKIKRFDLKPYFNFCLIEEELGFGKPDQRIFKIALEKLNLSNSDVWMVGDNLVWDVLGAQRSGIFGIWNDYKNKGLPKDSAIIPNRIINSISDLLI